MSLYSLQHESVFSAPQNAEEPWNNWIWCSVLGFRRNMEVVILITHLVYLAEYSGCSRTF